MSHSFPSSYVFIVRIWREPQAAQDMEPAWRGVVEHVTMQQRLYFRDLDQAVSFITTASGWTAGRRCRVANRLRRRERGA